MYGENECKRRITVWQDSEAFKPFGTYSMCSIINAENVYTNETTKGK